MLSATGTTIKISRGDSGILRFKFSQALTAGKTLIFSVAKTPGSKLLIEKSTTTTAGTTQSIQLAPTDTDLSPGQYCWDIRIVDEVAGTVITPVAPCQFVVASIVGDAEADASG